MKTTNPNPFIYKIRTRGLDGRVVERDAINLAGLMHLAGDRITHSNTEIVQIPGEQNRFVAITRTTVTIAGRGEFTEVGDAGPESCAPHLLPHALRLASTRSLCRCLRVGLGVAAVSVEELFDVALEATAAANDNASPSTNPHESSRASDAQRKLVWRLLVQRGLQGDDARAFVQRELGVRTVRDADRRAVSALIDKLKASGNAPTGTGG
jgi:hypothetical protein